MSPTPDFINIRLMTPRGRQLKAIAKSYGMEITAYIEEHIEQKIREGRIPARLDGFTIDVLPSLDGVDPCGKSVQITIGDFSTWPLIPILGGVLGVLLMQAANGEKPSSLSDFRIPDEISGNENLFHPSGILLVGPNKTISFKSVGRGVIANTKQGKEAHVATSMTRAMARSFARQIVDICCGLDPELKSSMQEYADDQKAKVKALAA